MTAHFSSPSIETLLEHAAWLRSLALALLADSSRADDVVQQTWVTALEHPPRTGTNLRGWLAAIARNVIRQLTRAERRRSRREESTAAHEALPATDELVERAELQRQLVAKVVRLGEPYRRVVLLRFFEGRSLAEIARHQSVPVRTVETQLRRAIEQLRARLDQDWGDRRAWGLMLLPLAQRAALATGITGSATAVLSGALVMTTKAKVAISLAIACGIVLWRLTDERGTEVDPRARPQPSATAAADASSVANPKPIDALEEPARLAVTTAAVQPIVGTTTEGSLLVHVTWSEDGTGAPGIWVHLSQPNEPEASIDARRGVTGSDGTCRFEGLPPGLTSVLLDRAARGNATIEAGAQAELRLEIAPGVTIDGIVVNKAGDPVAAADVLLLGAFAWGEGEVIARSATDGTFRLRAGFVGGRLMARAPGYAPSCAHLISGSAGTTVTKRLVLEGVGGEVAGRVFDPSGQPVPNALVRLGSEAGGGYQPIEDGSFADPSVSIDVRTDADGRFHFHGFRPGATTIAARAKGFAPWSGSVTVSLTDVAHVDIHLPMSAAVHGTVTDREGKPAAHVELRAGAFDLTSTRTRADDEGTFKFANLAPGTIAIKADGGERGKASATFDLAPGTTVEWNAVLSTGMQIAGRVLDEREAPLAGWSVQASPKLTGTTDLASLYHTRADTDVSGRFELQNCRDVAHAVTVYAPGGILASAVVRSVRPSAEELVIRIADHDVPTVHIIGRVVAPDGEPVANAQVSPGNQKSTGGVLPNGGIHHTAADGRFRIGPLPPSEYQLWVTTPGFPLLEIEGDHSLEPGETWDVGDVRVVEGGRITAQVSEEALRSHGKPRLEVLPVKSNEVRALDLGSMRLDGNVARSQPLAPGQYFLQVSGTKIAAWGQLVEVRSGAETKVDVVLHDGIAKTLRFRADGARMDRLHITICNASDSLVLVEDLITPFELIVVLEPGTYRIKAVADPQLETSASFATSDADPIEILLKAK